MNLDRFELLKQRNVLIAAGVVLLLALLWWLLWMSPEASKLTSLQAQQTQLQSRQTLLSDQLFTLQQDRREVHAAAPFIRRFDGAIPSLPDQGLLVVQLDDLANASGVTITLIGDNTITPPATGQSYSTMPISMTVTGGFAKVQSFVAGLYNLARLLTIQQLAYSGSANVNDGGNAAFTATIGATAYTTYVPPATAPTG
jgi:Tfp pilus assembly protein PilO